MTDYQDYSAPYTNQTANSSNSEKSSKGIRSDSPRPVRPGPEELSASIVEADTTRKIENTPKSRRKISCLGEDTLVGKYRFIKTIGKGNFAKVKLAQHTITKRNVAIKVMNKSKMNVSGLNKLMREVRIMKMLDHPNIVKLYEVMESDTTLYLVIEYCEGGEVFDYLVTHGRMKEKEARDKFRQILSAVQYCHRMFVIHRDLKAENLLLDSSLNIKIADFGFSNQYHPERKLETFCGSPPYAAPELFLGQKYVGPEVDVWSLGVILYTLVSGSLPFDGQNIKELRGKVLKGEFRIPFYMSAGCESLIKRMLVIDSQKRIKLDNVMDDSWVNEGMQPLKPYQVPPHTYDETRINTMMELGFTSDEISRSLSDRCYDPVMATYMLLDTTRSGPEDYMRCYSVEPTQVNVDFCQEHQNSEANREETSPVRVPLTTSNSEGRTHSFNDGRGIPLYIRPRKPLKNLESAPTRVQSCITTHQPLKLSPHDHRANNQVISTGIERHQYTQNQTDGDNIDHNKKRYSCPVPQRVSRNDGRMSYPYEGHTSHTADHNFDMAGFTSRDYSVSSVTSPTSSSSRESFAVGAPLLHSESPTGGSTMKSRKGIMQKISNRLRRSSIGSRNDSNTPSETRPNFTSRENSPTGGYNFAVGDNCQTSIRKFSFSKTSQIPSELETAVTSQPLNPEPRSLRFTWNFRTTSTKSPVEIMHEVQRVLLIFRIEYQQIENFTYQCYYDFGKSHQQNSVIASNNSRRHSLNSSEMSSTERRSTASEYVTTAKRVPYKEILYDNRSSVAYASNRTVQWEVEVCRLPLLFMNAVRFKRISGETFLYKAVVSHLTDEFNL